VLSGPVRESVPAHTERDRVSREVWPLHTRPLRDRIRIRSEAQVRDLTTCF